MAIEEIIDRDHACPVYGIGIGIGIEVEIGMGIVVADCFLDVSCVIYVSCVVLSNLLSLHCSMIDDPYSTVSQHPNTTSFKMKRFYKYSMPCIFKTRSVVDQMKHHQPILIHISYVVDRINSSIF